MRLFVPSSISAYGFNENDILPNGTPVRDNVDETTFQSPNKIYGIAK